jgi:glucose/arabinose dehydrogenase
MKRYAVLAMLGSCLSCVPSEVGAQTLAAGEPEDNFILETWAAVGSEITDLVFLSDGRAVTTQKGGAIGVFFPDGRPQVPPAMRVTVDSESEKGLLGVVRDAEDGLYFYASTGDDSDDKHKVYRGTISEGGEITIDMTRSIIGHGLEGPANHDGGGMMIHEGQLYVGVGDTGFNASPPQNHYGTCLNKANAKILRVNLDGSERAREPSPDAGERVSRRASTQRSTSLLECASIARYKHGEDS